MIDKVVRAFGVDAMRDFEQRREPFRAAAGQHDFRRRAQPRRGARDEALDQRDAGEPDAGFDRIGRVVGQFDDACMLRTRQPCARI